MRASLRTINLNLAFSLFSWPAHARSLDWGSARLVWDRTSADAGAESAPESGIACWTVALRGHLGRRRSDQSGQVDRLAGATDSGTPPDLWRTRSVSGVSREQILVGVDENLT
jgi:hypothetical protein